MPSLSGLTTTAKAVYSVLLWQAAGRPLIVVVDGNKQAEALSEAIQSFFDLLVADDRSGPQLLPALDVVPLQNLSPHAEILEAARHRAVAAGHAARADHGPAGGLGPAARRARRVSTGSSRCSFGWARSCRSKK